MFNSIVDSSEGQTPQSSQEPQPTRSSAGLVTLGLVAVNVLIYIVMVVCGVSPLHPTGREVLPWGADFGPLVVNGQWWRMFTACFLHFGIIHIAMNMYILFQIGLFVEQLYGSRRFLFLYIVAGLGGNFVSLYIHPLTVAAGASGAIFGLYGALLGFLLVDRGVVPTATALQVAKGAAIFLLYNLIYGLADGTTDLSAHIGGLVTGFLVGCILVRPRVSGPRRLPLAVTVTLVAVALGAGAVGLKAASRKTGGDNPWIVQVMTGAGVPLKNNGRIIYAGSATRPDAEKLAREFETLGYAKHPGFVALLSKDGGTTSISIPLWHDEDFYVRVNPLISKSPDGPSYPGQSVLPWNDPEVIQRSNNTGIALAPFVGGPPLELRLLTESGSVKRVLHIDTQRLTVGTRDSVLYSGAVTRQQAEALGKAMIFYGIFRDNGHQVTLVRASSGTELSFVVKDGAWGDPKTALAFGQIVRKVAPLIGGLPITVHLTDSTLKDHRDFVVR